ncbi:MAG: hypothetical protein KTR31_10535 [Myxococcales bacterium]|nr:hypothetical protein [Myxococcales bacterium]
MTTYDEILGEAAGIGLTVLLICIGFFAAWTIWLHASRATADRVPVMRSLIAILLLSWVASIAASISQLVGWDLVEEFGLRAASGALVRAGVLEQITLWVVLGAGWWICRDAAGMVETHARQDTRDAWSLRFAWVGAAFGGVAGLGLSFRWEALRSAWEAVSLGGDLAIIGLLNGASAAVTAVALMMATLGVASQWPTQSELWVRHGEARVNVLLHAWVATWAGKWAFFGIPELFLNSAASLDAPMHYRPELLALMDVTGKVWTIAGLIVMGAAVGAVAARARELRGGAWARLGAGVLIVFVCIVRWAAVRDESLRLLAHALELP